MKRLGELTYPEAAAIIAKGAVALWPVGSTEAHGPHLPLCTDVLIAEETSRRAAALIEARLHVEAVTLPPLAFTVTDFAAPFSGTISIPKETTLAYVREVLISTSALGFRAVCIVNAHLEPAHRYMLRDAVKAASASVSSPVLLADPSDRRFANTLTAEFKNGACHAGQYETSLVLAASPRAVRGDLQDRLEPLAIDLLAKIKSGARTFADAGAEDAYFGDPRAATSTEGEASYARLAEIVAIVVEEALEEI